VKVVKAYNVGVPYSTVVVIPKELGKFAGTKFCVKYDEKGRIIYEPLKKAHEFSKENI
jgi:hypothetical protein